MATTNRLDMMERRMRERARIVSIAQSALTEAEKNLYEAVDEYKHEKERLQRRFWAKEGLGWCQRCGKFFPKETIKLLYSECKEWDGGSPHKRIRSSCTECAEYSLSRPRGGQEEFQCFKAEKRGEDFFIFVSGKWRPLPEPKRTSIETERPYIPEDEYCFGKPIRYDTYPRVSLTIEENKVV